MSGYRDRSGFDPNAGGEALSQPPTWVQRIGIACLFAGAAMIFAYLAGEWGLTPKWIGSPVPAAIIAVAAGPLIGTGARRAPLSAEAKRQRSLIILAMLAVCVLGAALVIYFKGA